MIITNEPGYYKENDYGIRIENMLHVTDSGNKDFLRFENLTFVPYCKELIQNDLLQDNHKENIQIYYEKIEQMILPLL